MTSSVEIKKCAQVSLMDILTTAPEAVDRTQLHQIQQSIADSPSSLFTKLIEDGFVSEQRLLELLSEKFMLQRISLLNCRPSAEALALIPVELAVKRCCIPLRIEKNCLEVVINDPTDLQLIDDVRLILLAQSNGRILDPTFFLAAREEILEAIQENYGLGAEAAERLVTQAASDPSSDESAVIEQEELVDIRTDGEPSVVQFVNLLLVEGVRNRATDIHIEPFEGRLRIRQRIDGMLYEIPIPVAMADYSANIASRIKVMAQLDIAEKRLPQDGRIKVRIDGKEYDLRISV